MFVTTPKDDIIGTKPKDVDLSKSTVLLASSEFDSSDS